VPCLHRQGPESSFCSGFVHGDNGGVDKIDNDAADAIGDDFGDRFTLK
jgi:hypothetical protein